MKAFSTIILGLALAIVGVSRYQQHQVASVSQLRVLIPPPPFIEHFVFGYGQLVADSLWLRSIQDFDFCELAATDQRCKEGWLFQMLDAVTNLAPDLRMAYALGAPSLSVLVNDIEGATKIFEKGVRAMPRDWHIAFRASYHYLYEVRDNARAAELMWRAARNGAPEWTYSLAARLYTQEGQRELGLRLLAELEQSGASAEIVEAMRRKIDQAPTPQYPNLDESQ